VGVNNLTRPGARHPGEDYRCHCDAELLTTEQALKLGGTIQPPRTPQPTAGLMENYYGSEESKVEKGKRFIESLANANVLRGDFIRGIFGRVKPTDDSEIPKIRKGQYYKEELTLIDSEIEKGFILNADGSLAKTLSGDLNSITIDSPVSGKIITHSHPSGYSFSKEDILFLVKNEAKQIRIVSKNYVYTLSSGRKLTIDEIVSLREKMEKLSNKLQSKYDNQILKGMSPYEANFKQQDEFVRTIAKKFDLVYEVFKWK
jgi:hypothetical protein